MRKLATWCFRHRLLTVAAWIATLPSPTSRPRTSAASCSTVATTFVVLSSLKGAGGPEAIARVGRRKRPHAGR